MNKYNNYKFISLICAISLYSLAFVNTSVWAQNTSDLSITTELGNFKIDHYGPEDYGANPMNWGMVSDDQGILYIANLDGILEFDGVTWRLIRTPDESWALSTAIDSSGIIYVGLFNNLGLLEPDASGNLQFRSLLEYIDPDDRNFAEIWRVHCTKAGTYFRSRDKIFLWSDNKMKVLRTKSQFSLTSVLDDTLYVVDHSEGMKKTVGDSLVLIKDSIRLLPMGFTNILPYDKKHKLICTRKGLFLFNGQDFVPFVSKVNQFIRHNLISSAVILPGDKIAVSSYKGGVCIIDKQGKIVNLLNRTTGLRDDDIKNMYTDQDGNLWLCLNSGLACMRTQNPVSFFDNRRGLEGNVVSIIRHNNILYAATSQSIYYLDTAGQNNLTSDPEIKIELPVFRQVKGITSQGFWLLSTELGLLAATSGEGVYRIDGQKAYKVDSENEGAFVLTRSKINNRLVYVGLKNGLEILQFDNRRWIGTGRVKEITEEIRTIAEDTGGTLWLGTVFQGILRVRIGSRDSKGWNADIKRFSQEDGLPDGPANISKIDNNIIVATRKGLRQFDNEKNYFYPVSSIHKKLADSTLSAVWIEQDRFGQIFVWPHKKDDEPEFWVLKTAENDRYDIYREPYLPLSNFGLFHTTYTDPDSVLWIGCSNGLIRYDQKTEINEKKEYPAVIRRISTVTSDSIIFGGHKIEKLEQFILDYKNNDLRFEFAAPYYDYIPDIRYQVRLKGFDDKWSNWTSETIKDYTNLSSGSYNFEVRARNIYNKISSTASINFKILPPWYFSWWAYICYTLVFLSLVYLSDRLVRPQLIRREAEKAKIREAEIIREKNTELQLKNSQLEDILSKLQTAQNALIESESRFRSVAESANDAIITADRTGTISFWNKRAESLFGYTEDEALGNPLTMLMPERHRQAHIKGMERFYKTGKGKVIGHVVDIEAIRKNGEEFPVELTIAEWETHDGIYVTGIVRDITRRKQKEEDLRNTQAQLFQSEKMSVLGKLSAGMAHELNNPVSATKRSAVQMRKVFINLQRAYLQMSRLTLSDNQKTELMELAQGARDHAEKPISMDASVRSDKEQEIEQWLDKSGLPNAWNLAPSLVNLGYDLGGLKEQVNKFPLPIYSVVFEWQSHIHTIYSLLSEIDLGTDRIAEIVKAFKTYTYMDQAPIQKVDIHSDLENTIRIFRSRIDDKLTIELNFEKKLPEIEAYGGLLNQVWTNLIDNAIDAMSGKGKLVITTYRDDKDVVVEVTDNGPGIPNGNQDKIFDPFFTTKEIGKGTGLGLSICHNIVVQMHHGQISFSSKPGRTSFTVRLPIKFGENE